MDSPTPDQSADVAGEPFATKARRWLHGIPGSVDDQRKPLFTKAPADGARSVRVASPRAVDGPEQGKSIAPPSTPG